MNTTDEISTARPKIKRSSVAPLLVIMAIAVVVRIGPMPFAGNEGDMRSFDSWIQTIQEHGLFEFYKPSLHTELYWSYPPLSALSWAFLAPFRSQFVTTFDPFRDHAWLVLLKLAPVLCELALIIATYFWLRGYRSLRYGVPLLMAIFPGVVATTAWWGQYDSIFTLFLVLSLMALNRDRVILAWVMAGVAILFKQPAIVLLPLVAVVSFRRYGWRKTAVGVGAMLILILLVFAPFVIADGPQAAFSSYLSVGAYDYSANLTDNAFNVWHIVASLHKGSAFRFGDVGYSDAQSLFGPITFHQAGLVLMGGFTLVLLALVWVHAYEKKEFVWGTALYVAFFVLPTQVHERYLYPGAVLMILALSQDRRLLWPVIIVMVTFSYNIFQVVLSYLRPDLNLWPDVLSMVAGALNCVLLLAVLWCVFRPRREPEKLIVEPVGTVA